MTSFTLLHRLTPERNEKRFYAVMTGPSLLDPYTVIRFWGRIDGRQRMLIRAMPSPEKADKLAARLVDRRLKSGYQIIELQSGDKNAQKS